MLIPYMFFAALTVLHASSLRIDPPCQMTQDKSQVMPQHPWTIYPIEQAILARLLNYHSSVWAGLYHSNPA